MQILSPITLYPIIDDQESDGSSSDLFTGASVYTHPVPKEEAQQNSTWASSCAPGITAKHFALCIWSDVASHRWILLETIFITSVFVKSGSAYTPSAEGEKNMQL